MGDEVWGPLGPPKHEILTFPNNKTKGAQQHLVPQTLGQTNLAAAFALTGATIPCPGLMVGTLEEPPLPSELLVLGSLQALPCLLGCGIQGEGSKGQPTSGPAKADTKTAPGSGP